MCGILGIVAGGGRTVELGDEQCARMRDVMAARGPDGAGLWRGDGVVLGHRRLAVIDPSPAGSQPMLLDDAATGRTRWALTYNGELYNDAELRRELEREGVGFRTSCDTETVLHALARWGAEALGRFRGMYALGFVDLTQRTMLIARDPLGIKPLYFAPVDGGLVFASAIPAILAHPGSSAAPNLRMVSAYLTTIRTVLGRETLFEGVFALAPGEHAVVDLRTPDIGLRIGSHWRGRASSGGDGDLHAAAGEVRRTIEASVLVHLRSDVPMCSLLSGGLDSSAIALCAKHHKPDLRTYCAGATVSGAGDDGPLGAGDDLAFARRAAAFIGTSHSEAIVQRSEFLERWSGMVREMGVPLSTPNEVAIYTVAERLRADGCIVTLSGEGADELLAGYEGPMDSAWRLYQEGETGARNRPGLHELDSNAWTGRGMKGAVLAPGIWSAIEQDAWLTDWYASAFERAREECGGAPLASHLRFHRMVNLTGLLQRLDTATMLAGVEGRTPFADARFAEVAESLPMAVKYRGPGEGEAAGAGGMRTKIALREAFAGALPEEVVRRRKASFPLPFVEWMGEHGELLRRSAFARAVFSPDAVELVASSPQKMWNLAWPMLNIAMWGDRWWG